MGVENDAFPTAGLDPASRQFGRPGTHTLQNDRVAKGKPRGRAAEPGRGRSHLHWALWVPGEAAFTPKHAHKHMEPAGLEPFRFSASCFPGRVLPAVGVAQTPRRRQHIWTRHHTFHDCLTGSPLKDSGSWSPPGGSPACQSSAAPHGLQEDMVADPSVWPQDPVPLPVLTWLGSSTLPTSGACAPGTGIWSHAGAADRGCSVPPPPPRAGEYPLVTFSGEPSPGPLGFYP